MTRKGKPAKRIVQVIDLFSGCGGMSVGFLNAETRTTTFRVLGGLDIDPHAAATYRRMIGRPCLETDVQQLTRKAGLTKALDAWGYDQSHPLILIGCAPCQGFSSHRKKDTRTDERNELLSAFGKVVNLLSPDLVVMENVPEIFFKQHWKHFESFRAQISKGGYSLRARVENLATFGVPQERYRALVLGAKDPSLLKMPPPKVHPDNFATVRDAIGHLPPLKAGERDPIDAMHMTSKHRPETVKLLSLIPKDGGSRRSLPNGVGPECHTRVDGFRDVYGRLWWNRPAVSITARCRTPSCGRFTHPEQDRGLSVREAALLQGFPPEYEFEGPFDDKYKQIGNAVSPIFSKALAEHIDAVSAGAERDVPRSGDIVEPITKSISSALAGMKRRLRKETPPSAPRRAYTLVDLFCGAGGLSLGFKQAGFTPSFAADFERLACETYAKNLGDHVRQMDLSNIDPKMFARLVEKEVGAAIDVVAGGPPCQGWSIQRRGKRSDGRNDLTLKFVDLALALKPSAIVMENVPTLLGERGRQYMQLAYDRLTAAGYSISKDILDASSFGVPQLRRRAFVVALRRGGKFSFPTPTHNKANWVTVRDAIGDLPPPREDGLDHPDYKNHKRVAISALNLKRLSFVPEGGGRLDVPAKLQLPCHRKDNGHRHLDVFGRLWWDRPAGTITAMFDNFTRGRFAHPEQLRNITSREGARLQSFPDTFEFVGPKKDVARQIGNAVPPALANAVASALMKTLMQQDVIAQEETQGSFAFG